MKKWLIVDRYKRIICDTDDLDRAWDICETCSRCGQQTTVMSRDEINC